MARRRNRNETTQSAQATQPAEHTVMRHDGGRAHTEDGFSNQNGRGKRDVDVVVVGRARARSAKWIVLRSRRAPKVQRCAFAQCARVAHRAERETCAGAPRPEREPHGCSAILWRATGSSSSERGARAQREGCSATAQRTVVERVARVQCVMFGNVSCFTRTLIDSEGLWLSGKYAKTYFKIFHTVLCDGIHMHLFF